LNFTTNARLRSDAMLGFELADAKRELAGLASEAPADAKRDHPRPVHANAAAEE